MNKYTNKIISALLTVILILSCMPSFAEEINDEDNSKVYEILTSFGIINDSDMIYYEDTISRAIFLKYAVRCAGITLSDNTDLPEGIYTDINETTEGYEEIITARKMKLVSDAGLFNPDRNITLAEAAKIMVSLLGYGSDAEYKGGYPIAYLNMASELDIFDGVVFEPDGSLKVDSFVLLLLNTIEANPMKIFKLIDDSGEYYLVGEKSNEPLMTQSLGIYKNTGVVSSNAYASLLGTAKVSGGEILIGEEKYLVKDSDAIKYFGLNVDVYYKLDNKSNKKTVLYLNETDNEITTILSEDIDLTGTTSRAFSYYKPDGKKETLNNLLSPVFIYNGGLKAISETDLEPSNGAVVLIDNNNDGKIDVIKVNNYRSVLVSSVSSVSYSVADSLGGANLDLDITKDDFDVIIEKDGKAASFEDISKDTVISYAEAGTPASGDIIKFVYISTKKAEGKIDSISQNTITVDGIEFNAAQSILTSSVPGEEGIFYIDMYNRIVVKKARRDMVYGYITDKAVQTGLDGGYVIKIFTENNRWVELNLADHVKFILSNGSTSTETQSNAYSIITTGQLVRYKVNLDAEITEIHFAQDIPAFSPDEDAAISNDTFRKSMVVCSDGSDPEHISYRSTVQSFGNKVGLRDDTKIFVIPDPGFSVDSKDFHVVGPSSLRGDAWYYDITAYDVDKSVQAGACVMISTASRNIVNPVDGESNFMVVKGISKVLTDDNEETYAINGAYSGDTDAKLRMSPNVEITDDYTDTTISVNSLQKGDVLQLAFDSEGYVAGVTRYYNILSQTNTPFYSTEDEYSTSTKMCGIVSRIVHDSYKIVFYNGKTKNGLYSTANLNRVYVYDKTRNVITLADTSAIEEGDYIVAYVRQFSLREAVIIR